MYEKIRTFIEKNIRAIGRTLVSVVILVWILSRFIPALSIWIRSQNLIAVISLVLIVEVLVISTEQKKRSRKSNFEICDDQHEVTKKLEAYIEVHTPPKADLIELSAVTINELIECLKGVNCKIRLLLLHPDKAINNYQNERIRHNIENLYALTFQNYKDYEIRLYGFPASIRGRNFNNRLINMGWYTYRRDRIGSYGHINPMTLIDTATEQGKVIQDFFNRTFDDLWEDSGTITLDKYLKSVKTQNV